MTNIRFSLAIASELQIIIAGITPQLKSHSL